MGSKVPALRLSSPAYRYEEAGKPCLCQLSHVDSIDTLWTCRLTAHVMRAHTRARDSLETEQHICAGLGTALAL